MNPQNHPQLPPFVDVWHRAIEIISEILESPLEYQLPGVHGHNFCGTLDYGILFAESFETIKRYDLNAQRKGKYPRSSFDNWLYAKCRTAAQDARKKLLKSNTMPLEHASFSQPIVKRDPAGRRRKRIGEEIIPAI